MLLCCCDHVATKQLNESRVYLASQSDDIEHYNREGVKERRGLDLSVRKAIKVTLYASQEADDNTCVWWFE